jgi:hypothetical protein
VTTLQQALEGFMDLPLEEREMALDILERRNAETRRGMIAAEAKEALAAYRRGELPSPQTAAALIRELNDTD